MKIFTVNRINPRVFTAVQRDSQEPWSSYWTTLISATVEDAAPTKIVLTSSVAETVLVATDFTIAGFVITTLARDATNKIITLTLSTAAKYNDNLTVMLKGVGHVVANNIIPSFKITVDTSLAGSPATHFILPTTGAGYDFDCNWGDGITTTHVGTPGNVDHTYAVAGIYQLSIKRIFPQIYFNYTLDILKIKSIDQWGNGVFRSMFKAFMGCFNVALNYNDIPDFQVAINLTAMFQGCINVKGSFGTFNIRNVLGMESFISGVNINDTGTTTNLDDTYNSWAAQEPLNPNLTLNMGTSKYSAAGAAARQHLVSTHGWTITDGGLQP